MNGHIILNTPLIVDVWKRGTDKYVHFLSHCHADHMVGLTSTWRLPIYTTHFNAWMLKNRIKIKPNLLRPLSVGDSHIISVPNTGQEFTVTMIDANHCPGSVMFLFQGSFGTILYTGDIRYDPVMLENRALAHVIEHELLDVLYIDNTYASPKCKIPSRKEATQKAIEIIREHPQHRILLGLRSLGKEELLREIALEFCERICMSEDRLSVLHKLQYEDVFTTDPERCRIHVVNFNSVTASYMKQRQKKHPHIAILPTALYCVRDVTNLQAQHGIYVIPYSDHSPYEELFTFISQLKPAKIYPIVKETNIREKKILPSSHELIRTFSTIPESLYELCCRRKTKGITCQNKEQTYCVPDNLMALPSQMFHEIKHTKSSSRPGITQHKKLSKASEKKGVHFDSSHTSDEDGETSQIDVQHTRELETEEVTVSTSGGKYSRVKIPCNVKNKLLDVKVKLYDISVLGKDVPGILSQLNTSNNKAFLRNLSSIHNRESPPQGRDDIASYREPTYNSDGRTSPHKEMDTASEGLGNCLSPHDSGNSFRDMSLSHAAFIKHLVIKQEDLSDTECASICSVSTVMAPQTTSCKEEKDDDADKEYFEFMDSVSAKDEDVHTQGTYSGGENEDLSTGITGETWKNAMVIFPSDSDGDNSLLEISELGAAAEKPESRQSNPTTNLYRSKKSARCQSFDECTPFVYTTQKAITKHSPGLRKRKRACTEPIESTDTDSDSSGNSDDTRFKLNTISKRRKCDSKENGISLDNHCLPHPCCPSYINNIDARNDQPALISGGCSCNPDNASSDRLGIMAGYVSEPNMQQLDTQTRNWPQVSLAPTLLTCSVVESLANKKQVASGHDKHIKKKNDSATLAEESKSEMRDSNITVDLENGKISETADCSRNIIFNKETITSEICDSHSFEEPHQAVVSLGLSQNEREDKMLCNTSCNKMEGSVNSQSTDLSFHTCTISEDRAKSNVTRRNMDVVCVSKNSHADSALHQSSSDLFSSADERTTEFHVMCTEKNSNVSQAKQISEKHDTLHIEPQQHDVGIQCEPLSDCHPSPFCHGEVLHAPTEMCVNNDSMNIQSLNSVRTKNLLQDGEMFITDSGSIKNVHSDESKEVSAGGRKHISSKLTFELGKKPNVSNCQSKNCTELSSSRNTAVKDSTNVYKSYSLKNGSSCENAGPKNESPFANDSLLWNNNDYETGTVQSTGQNIAIVITDKSHNYENIRDVRNIRHSSKDSNRTLISESEACRCPGSHITCNPSTNEVDRNYWTNGNRTPFAIVEVFLAAQKLSFQKDFLSMVASETFSNSSDDGDGEDGNCQQKQMVVPPLVLNLKHSIQQGKQLKVPLSECHYKCSTQKNMLIEQRAQKKWREIKCEETHTFYSLSRPVSDHAFCEASSGRQTSRETFSDSNRINDSGKTPYNMNSVPLDLYSLEESSIGLSPCSIVSNTGTTCEQIINDHGIAPTPPEGSSGLQGECGVVPEEFERSHDLLGERGIVPQTSAADDLQGACGVVPETSGADDLQGACGVVPETSGADDLQGECGVVPETSGADDLQGACGVVPETSGADDLQGECGVVPETSGANDLQGEYGVVPEEFERSHDLLGERGIVPETTAADDLPGECGVVPETSGVNDMQGACGVVPETSGANDMQGACGVVPETSGADDLQGECGVVPEEFERSHDLLGEHGIVPETTAADDLQGECGVVPEEFERSHDLLGECGIVPETTAADDLPGECGVVPATSQISHDLLCENGVARDMSEISDNLPNKTIVSSETQEGSDDLIGRKRSAPEIAKGSDSLLHKNGVASETPEGSDCLLHKNRIASETPEGSDYFLSECGVVLETPEGSDCLLDKHGISSETPEGSDYFLGEFGVVLETPEGSDCLLDKHGVSSETPEGSDYFLGECGVVPETPEGSDCLLDKHGVASETLEGSDYFLRECGVVPETPEGSDCLLDEHGVACKTSEGSDDLLNKSGVASQTPKGSDELLGKNRVTSEVPERSDNFVGDYQFLSETPEGSYHLLGGNGVPSEKSEGSNDLLDKSRIVPETSERSDDLLRRSSVALETPQKPDNLHGYNDHDIVPDTSGGNTVTTEAYSSSDELSLSSLMGTFQGARKGKCEQIMQIKSSMFLDLMQRKALLSNEVLKCIVVRKEDECSKKLGTIRQITALRKKFDDCFIKRAVLNDHMYYNGDIYFDRKGMSLDEIADIRKLLPTAHIVNKFSSTSGVLDNLNHGQNPDGRLNQCKRNELSNPSILPVKEVKIELPDVSFTERNVAEGKEEGRKRAEVYFVPFDDIFPSDRVIHVTKTYERTTHSQDANKHVIQNSQNSDTSSGDNMFPSYQVMYVNKTYGRTRHSQHTRKHVIQNSQNSDISDNIFPSDRVVHVKSNTFLPLMQRKTLPSNEVLQSNVVKKGDECSEELGTIRQVNALRKNFDDCFTKRAILNDHKYYKDDIDFDRKGMSDKNADIRKLLPTAPIVNKFSSTSGVLDSLNDGQNPHGRLHQCKQNELSNPSILPVKEVKTDLLDDSFTERNNVAEGKEERIKRTEVYAIPSDDDMFPSDREMHVPKTHLCVIQDDIKRVIQNSQKSLTLYIDSPSETHSRQWKSSGTFKIVRKFIVNRSTLQEHLKTQRQVRFVSILKHFKRKREETSSEYSSSVYKHRRVSDAT